MRGAEISRTRGVILREAPAAVAALSDLAAGAGSESVRLGGAKAVLGLALPRVGDFALDSISAAEFRKVISEVIKLSMAEVAAKWQRDRPRTAENPLRWLTLERAD